MIKLTSVDAFKVDGRQAFSFAAISGFDPRTLRGQTVEVDGKRVRVRSVETFAIYDATGTSFALIVEPE